MAMLETTRKIFQKKDSREPACQANKYEDLVYDQITVIIQISHMIMIMTSNVLMLGENDTYQSNKSVYLKSIRKSK